MLNCSKLKLLNWLYCLRWSQKCKMTFQKKKIGCGHKSGSQEEEINIINGTRISDLASKKLDVKKR